MDRSPSFQFIVPEFVTVPLKVFWALESIVVVTPAANWKFTSASTKHERNPLRPASGRWGSAGSWTKWGLDCEDVAEEEGVDQRERGVSPRGGPACRSASPRCAGSPHPAGVEGQALCRATTRFLRVAFLR